KILDLANPAIFRLDVVTRHRVGTAQMVIARHFSTVGNCLPSFTVTLKVEVRSPPVWTDPIRRPVIMPIVDFLELAGDGLVAVQGWAVLDLLFGQIDCDLSVGC